MNSYFRVERSTQVATIILLAASCLLSAVRYFQDPLLNADGVLYAHIAQSLIRGNTEALSFFDLTFYPWLISLVGKALSTNAIIAGQILNIVLIGLVTHAFLRCYRLFFGDQKYLLLAGFVFICHPQLVDYRSYFIREFGMWAFSLYAIAEVRAWQLKPNLKSAALWPVLICIAVAFRPESSLLFLLGITPLVTTEGRFGRRLASTLQFNYAALVSLPLVLLALIFSDSSLLSNIAERIFVLYERFNANWSTKTELFRQHVLTHRYNEDTASWSLAAALVILVPMKILSAWSPHYIVPLAWARYRSGPIDFAPESRKLLALTLALISVYLVVYVLSQWFMSSRYAMLAGILLLLPTSKIFVRYIKQGSSARYLIGFILAASLADGLISTGSDKQYLIDAISWSKNNLPEEAELISNKTQLSVQPLKQVNYGRQEALLRTTRLQHHTLSDPEAIRLWSQADYLLVRLKKRESKERIDLLATGILVEEKSFANADGDQAVIFRVSKSSK